MAKKTIPEPSGLGRCYNSNAICTVRMVKVPIRNPDLMMQSMQIAQVIPCTEAEGPGKRFAIWFQGCPLRCPGCCNPEFLPFQGGETKTLNQMCSWISQAREE